MELDLRKTAADAAYIAVGAGVLGFQQAQVRRREAGARIATLAKDAQSVIETRSDAIRSRVSETTTSGLDSATATLKTLDPRQWVEPVIGDVRSRVEPVVEQLKGINVSVPGPGGPRAAQQGRRGRPGARRIAEGPVRQLTPRRHRRRRLPPTPTSGAAERPPLRRGSFWLHVRSTSQSLPTLGACSFPSPAASAPPASSAVSCASSSPSRSPWSSTPRTTTGSTGSPSRPIWTPSPTRSPAPSIRSRAGGWPTRPSP